MHVVQTGTDQKFTLPGLVEWEITQITLDPDAGGTHFTFQHGFPHIVPNRFGQTGGQVTVDPGAIGPPQGSLKVQHAREPWPIPTRGGMPLPLGFTFQIRSGKLQLLPLQCIAVCGDLPLHLTGQPVQHHHRLVPHPGEIQTAL